MYNQKLIDSLIEEGKRVGKSPWCADGYHEHVVFEILNQRIGANFPQETMKETIERRDIESLGGINPFKTKGGIVETKEKIVEELNVVGEIYIKMCDCPEIQDGWVPKTGDCYVPFSKDFKKAYGPMEFAHGIRAIKEDKRIEYLSGFANDRIVYLPRQGQLQDMLNCKPAYGSAWSKAFAFSKYCVVDFFPINYSMEQLWLAFVMWELHSKQWLATEQKWTKLT